MSTRTRLIIQIGVAVSLASTATRAEQDVFATAKTLYASASYEAALSALSGVDGLEDADQVDTYRALCLLALDRTLDAEQALERIVVRKPLYALDDAQHSPRLVAMFHGVRRRVLPAAAQRLYSTAKADFENKQYASAATQFKQLLAVVGDQDATDQTGVLADLRQLAGGFLTLTEASLAERPATPAPAVPPAAAPPRAEAPSPSQPIVYTAFAPGVTPPITAEQKLPPWTSGPFLRGRNFVWRLELVIDEAGAVQSATLIEPIWPPYDLVLLSAAKLWRYRPALKDGQPVRFRKVLDIQLDPMR